MFRDPKNSFKGIKNYQTIFWSLRFHGGLFFKDLRCEIKRLWQLEDTVIRYGRLGILCVWCPPHVLIVGRPGQTGLHYGYPASAGLPCMIRSMTSSFRVCMKHSPNAPASK